MQSVKCFQTRHTLAKISRNTKDFFIIKISLILYSFCSISKHAFANFESSDMTWELKFQEKKWKSYSSNWKRKGWIWWDSNPVHRSQKLGVVRKHIRICVHYSQPYLPIVSLRSSNCSMNCSPIVYDSNSVSCILFWACHILPCLYNHAHQ